MCRRLQRVPNGLNRASEDVKALFKATSDLLDALEEAATPDEE